MVVQERTQRTERGVRRQDQLRRLAAERGHDLFGPGLDQGMAAVGLIAQQVVHEEMASGTVQTRVEVQRTLPSPDVEMRMVPDRGAPAQVAPQFSQGDPLPPPLVADRQLFRGHAQVVAGLDEPRAADRPRQHQRRARRKE
jgi:hypothetical protein